MDKVLDKVEHAPQTVYLRNYEVSPYFIDEVDLTFDLQEEVTIVTSSLRIRRRRQQQDGLTDLVLNGEALSLESVKLDGESFTDYTVNDKQLTLHHLPAQAVIEIVTKIYPQKNTELSGLYKSGNTFCTQCESEGFRRITYFLDRPDVLARYSTKIIADEKRYPSLLSNGNLIESGKNSGGRHWAKWEDPFKKPCYLFALVAGDFDMIEDKFVTQSGRDVILRIYVDKGYQDQLQHAMYSVKEAMRWDELAYGREYDLDIYMIVAINDFNSGAMENKGLNIFNTKYVLAKPETATDDDYIHILSVIAHEYFHNWSGNRVTCRDWFQLSLKEGLTIFRDQSFSEEILSPSVMRIRDVIDLRESQFPEDAGPLAHPVRPESYIEISNFYTATVYNKGAEVLRMMQTLIGKAMFRKGMDLYFARYDGQAVTIDDFAQCMQDVSGVDLTQFKRWYSQAGTPIVKVEDEYDPNNKRYTLRMQQSCPATPDQKEKMPFEIPIRMGLLDQHGQVIPLHVANEPIENEKVLRLKNAIQTFKFENVNSKPIPSLLRHFSAPVKLYYDYSDADLLFLVKNDVDAFNRWESAQQYLVRVILDLVKQHQIGEGLYLPDSLVEMYRHLLTQHDQDPFLLSEMLKLPSEKYIGEQMQVVDVDAIHHAREFILLGLAQQLQSHFLEIYLRDHQANPEPFSALAVGKRQLKNRCLAFLMLVANDVGIGTQQFKTSLKTNMTDTLAALTGLSNLDIPERVEALAQFYQTWRQDPLVVDKWFAIQAATKLPSALSDVRKLMHHEAFDLKNPNKVYALIGTFGHRNPVHFHAKDGSGYVFLREAVQALDKINPHVSARMVKPLTTWKRYDKERQQLMQEQLKLLLDKKISADLYEIVSKSL